MSSDRKMRGKRPKKRRFCGNKYTKQRKIDFNSELDCSEEICDRQDSIFQSTSKSESESATPTTSQMKIQNLYDLMNDSSSDGSCERPSSLLRSTDKGGGKGGLAFMKSRQRGKVSLTLQEVTKAECK